MKKPLVTAHTGCNDTPVNSMTSIYAGDRWGADINEIDVRATKDGIPILWHNDALETMNSGIVKVKNITHKELKKLETRGELKLPCEDMGIISLEEVFDAIKEQLIVLNLDLKDDECIKPVARLVKENGFSDRVIFSGCEKERASYLKRNFTDFQVLLNAEESLFKRTDLSDFEKVRILCDDAVSIACCGLNINQNYCSPELIDYADRRFLPVVVWTVSSNESFEKFIDMGVYSINTLEVKELVELKQME